MTGDLDRARTYYQWGNRKYLTISGLHNFARTRYPRCGLTFGEKVMIILLPNGAHLHFKRSIDSLGNSFINYESEDS